MPRYYFIIETTDYIYDDPEGEQLPNDGAAKDHVRRVIYELKDGDFESAGAIMHIRNESGETIHSIAFWLLLG